MHVDTHAQTFDTLVMAFRNFALIANAISDDELETARSTVETADAIGFIVDPTMYRDALYDGRLDRQRDLLKLFRDTKKELKRLFPEGWTT